MAYTPQTWTNNDPTTPVSAARLTVMENGIAAASALTSASGALASNYTLTTAYSTFLTTPSLAAGTWLLNFGALAIAGLTTQWNAQVVTGTATATLSGKTLIQVNLAAAGNTDVSMSCLITVTAAGTIVLQGKYTGASGSVGSGGTTGYTLTKIA